MNKKSNYKNVKNKKTSRSSKNRRTPNFNEDVKRGSEPKSSSNDSAWYFKYPELMAAAARLPFPNRPGVILNDVIDYNVYFGGQSVTQTTAPKHYSIPGIMAINWIPSIGRSDSVVSPASMTAKELYSNVRKEFSGNLSADAPDMFIQILALDSIYSYIAYLKRIYRVVNTMTPLNYLVPEGLLNAMGFDPTATDALFRDKIKLYGHINTLVRMSRKFICPNVFSLIERHYWLNDRVYTDDASVNSQMYIFNPKAFYKFTLLPTPDGVEAGGLSLDSPVLTGEDVVDHLYNFGLSLFDALSSWEDAYDINGYFMKAFGNSPLFEVSELDISEILEASYNTEVLIQIQNATAIPITHSVGYTLNMNVSQDPNSNRLLCDPKIILNDPYPDILSFSGGGYVNLPNGLTSAEMVVEATRLKSRYDVTRGAENVELKVHSGTETVLYYNMVTRGANNTWNNYVMFGSVLNNTYGATDTSAHIMALIGYLSTFDWHPILPLTSSFNEDGKLRLDDPTIIGDIKDFTMMSEDDFDAINRMCLFSEFNSFAIR